MKRFSFSLLNQKMFDSPNDDVLLEKNVLTLGGDREKISNTDPLFEVVWNRKKKGNWKKIWFNFFWLITNDLWIGGVCIKLCQIYTNVSFML